MGHFSIFVHFEWKLLISSALSVNHKKENLNHLALWYYTCVTPWPKFDKEWNIYLVILVKKKFLEKLDFKAYFSSFLFDQI